MNAVRELTVDIGGTAFVIASDDDYLATIKHGFEPGMVSLFRTVASGSEIILDIGANIGCTAILFADLAKRVYAFEPAPSTYALLVRNVLRSGKKNIVMKNLGLGAEPDECTLMFATCNRSGGFVTDQKVSAASNSAVNANVTAVHAVENIIVRPLDQLAKYLHLPQVDFMKIDVEGFEAKVLLGARQTLSEFKPIVVMELNHWCLNAFQKMSIPDFFDLLRSIFPILFAVDGNSYLDLNDERESYSAMYHHILRMRFPNILAAFSQDRLADFFATYKHGL